MSVNATINQCHTENQSNVCTTLIIRARAFLPILIGWLFAIHALRVNLSYVFITIHHKAPVNCIEVERVSNIQVDSANHQNYAAHKQ